MKYQKNLSLALVILLVVSGLAGAVSYSNSDTSGPKELNGSDGGEEVNSLADTPWPMFGHDLNHTSQSPYNTSHVDGTEKWSFSTGGMVYSSPAIGSDGTIYVGSNDGNLYAVNPDGTEKWSFSTGSDVRSSPAIGSDGKIYVGSNDGNLYALNPDGTEKWSFSTTGAIGYSSPAIGSDDTIYVGSNDNNLYAVNPDGTEKWSFSTGGDVRSGPAIGSDGTIYVGSDDNNLYAVNPDGSEKWSFTTGGNVWSSPTIGSDGTIYVGSEDDNLYAVNPDGSEKWSFGTGDDVRSSPAIGSDGTIYVGSWDNNLYAVSPDGTEKWNFSTGDYVYSSPAIGSDGTIYVGSGDNNLYGVNSNGTERWSFSTGDSVGSSPAIGSDGRIYIGSLKLGGGNLYAIGEGYSSHGPIRINNNNDLAAEASSGNGTPSDPYVLEKYEIDGGGHGFCMYIGNTTDHFIVRDNYLHNASGKDYEYWRDTGLYLYNSKNGEVVNNYISDDNDHYGVYIESSDNHTLENNDASYNNGFGIYSHGGSHKMMNNTVSYNWDYGIYLDEGSENTLINNDASNNYYGICLRYSNNNTLKDNTASDQYYGIEITESDNNTLMNNTASSNFEFGILIQSSSRNTLTDNEMVDDGIVIYGHQLSEWNTHTIDTSNMVNGEPAYYWKNRTDGTIPSGAGQVILANCTGVTIENQYVSSASTGIELGYSEGNTVANNTAKSNQATWGSINLWDSSNNRLINNTVSDSEIGIFLGDSDDNNLTENEISNNNNNEEYGIYLNSASSNNLIYHNNIINNFYQAYDEGDNYWNADYPTGGNYWSDYSGSDDYSGPNQDKNGSDGIGDSPYTDIDGGSNVDEYPLMGPYSSTSINCSSGWNFISFDVRLTGSDINITTILDDPDNGIAGNYDKVMYYNASQDEWRTFAPDRGSHYNDLNTWNRKRGLWIHMTTDDTLTVEGIHQDTTNISLQPGWNMVGYPSGTDKTASNVLPSEVSKIGVFNGSREYNLQYIYNLDNYTMTAGEGYWIYNSGDTAITWTVDY